MTPKPDDEERDLFRAAIRGVKPLTHDRHAPAPRRPPPRARFTRADQLAVLEESLHGRWEDPSIAGGDELSYRRPGIQEVILRKLRRGQYRIDGEIDLHGLTVTEAKHALRGFLAAALARRLRCVRIIHGKGLRSGHRGPVLKSAVSGVLGRTSAVAAYVSARPVDGGTGALYVLLAC